MKEERKSSIIYQSLSFTMIDELLKSPYTPAKIKVWLYLSILQKYKKTIYASNEYISKKLNLPLGTVKYAIGKLRDEGLITIINPKSWKRQIILTLVANIKDSEIPELFDKNEYAYHNMYGRKLYKDYIYLTKEEYQIILDRLKDTKDEEFYFNGLNNYLKNSKIKYESHYKMLCIWINKNQEQIKSKKKKYMLPIYDWFIDLERNHIPIKSVNDTQELFDYNWLDDEEL